MTDINTPIYLDYAATTPVDPRVAEKMTACLTMDGNFANPASRSHRFGWQAEEAVDFARSQIAELVNCDPRELVFTSGATESDNLAIKGVAMAYADKGKHVITMSTEHKAVLDSCGWLETQGFEVTYLAPGSNGLLDLAELEAAIRPDTVLVSVMHVNNELGVIQDIAAIGALCQEKHILFHVDAAQSTGKVAIDLQTLPVDLMSFSAHKTYGPKGIGALFVRRRPKIHLHAQIHGGGHERGMRSGTLPTHQIVGMGEAFAIAGQELEQERVRLAGLRQRFLEIVGQLPGVVVNGNLSHSVAGVVNVGFDDVDGESLIMALHELAVSSGSACNSASMAPSYVLKALGLDDALAHSSLRFSFGRFTTRAEVEFAANKVVEVVSSLRQASSATPIPRI
ncbi:IscS subfamily cysteine desulfurase [Aestuariibacter salexigens]|uniref:IscS subfamily cysteine desulfurase n=1 Tax=Aestuariibacter salexigens TaxID=226010 RepID=UPI00041A8820|nr:IscS subfamily cysteine desulfurase [Aestuariibacter salexigens]